MIRTAGVGLADPKPGQADFMLLASTTLESLREAIAQLEVEGVPGAAIVSISAPVLGQPRVLTAQWEQLPSPKKA